MLKASPTKINMYREFGNLLVDVNMADKVSQRVAKALKENPGKLIWISFREVIVMTPDFIARAFFNRLAYEVAGFDIATDAIVSMLRFSRCDENMLYLINKEKKKFLEMKKGLKGKND